MLVIDSHGRELDSVTGKVLESDAEYARRMRREHYARVITGAASPRIGRYFSRTTKRVAIALTALCVLGWLVSATESEPVPVATTTVLPAGSVPGQPVSAASTYVAPIAQWQATPERTAPFSGSTEADARDGWTNVVVSENGHVKLNGVLVDNVRDTESPLRARYLASLERQSQRVGADGSNVGEGLRFCIALDAGLPTAERELMDANADHNTYGTSARRMAIAVASVSYFCPAHMPA